MDHTYQLDPYITHENDQMMKLHEKESNLKRIICAKLLETIFNGSLAECNMTNVNAYGNFSFRYYLYTGLLKLDETLNIKQLD